MTHAIKRLLLAAALSFSPLAGGCAGFPAYADPAPQPPGPTEPLTIVQPGGKTLTFQVELADTPEKSELGLMYRKEMAKDHGMIFDFGPPRETQMWMKNTFIPLDMVFFDNTGLVTSIVENARPFSERLIDPGIPVRGVIEFNGGVVKAMGIKPGDKVQHKIFSHPPVEPKPAAATASAKPVKPAPKTPNPKSPEPAKTPG